MRRYLNIGLKRYMSMKLLVDKALERDPLAVPEAREAIAGVTETLMPYEQMTMQLLTSEVVGNEVRHGESTSPIELRVEDHGGFIRVEVESDGPGFAPIPHPESSDAESGRGLILLERLSERFGVRKEGTKVCAWFDLVCSRI
jgi:anti-sigma regulatory factor (Ser/Thr protein kinase)